MTTIPIRPSSRIALLAAIGMLVIAVQASPAWAQADLGQQQRPGQAPQGIATTSKAGGLASSELRETVDRLQRGLSAPRAVDVAGSRVSVEILHQLGQDAVAALVKRLGGEVKGAVGEGQTLAELPFDRLAELEQSKGVQFLRPPLPANVLPQEAAAPAPGAGSNIAAGAVVGEELQKTNAAAWQAAGQTGQGVKVGIIDYFDASLWNAAAAAGEVPAPAGTFCLKGGTPCDIWSMGVSHGEGVAEVVHDMAPGAALYLASVASAEDLQAAIDYFASQGVRVISRSLGAYYDGPGDGTGPTATIEDRAVAAGMTWFNSAGNSAGNAAHPGAYWRGPWVDENSNQMLDFASGDDQLAFNCGSVIGLRWNDWELDPTDYDAYVYDDANLTVKKASSMDSQPGGAPPLEHPHPTCGTAPDVDYLVIKLFPGGGTVAGDRLEFMVNQSAFEYWQNPYSASQPASDTKSEGGLSVGAIEPALGATIAYYSSQGPTNDRRTKPDLVAAACVKSFTAFPGNCFNGTSAATPVTSGAAALVLGAFPFYTPKDLKIYLLNQATVPRGEPGPDNVYGAGELLLPAPPGTQASAGAVAASGGPHPSAGASNKQLCNTNIGLAKSARVVRGGAIRLKFSLPRKTHCRVTVTVRGSGRKGKLLGRATALLSGARGGTLRLRLRINSTGRRLLNRNPRIRAEVLLQSGTGAHRSATAFKTKRIVIKD